MSSDRRRLAFHLLILAFLLAAMLVAFHPSGAQEAPDLWEFYWRTRLAEAQERQAEALERQNLFWLYQQPAPGAPLQLPAVDEPQVPQGATWCVGEGPLRRCY